MCVLFCLYLTAHPLGQHASEMGQLSHGLFREHIVMISHLYKIKKIVCNFFCAVNGMKVCDTYWIYCHTVATLLSC